MLFGIVVVQHIGRMGKLYTAYGLTIHKLYTNHIHNGRTIYK